MAEMARDSRSGDTNACEVAQDIKGDDLIFTGEIKAGREGVPTATDVNRRNDFLGRLDD